MAFTTEYIARKHYIFGTLSGRLDAQLLRDYANALTQLAEQHECKRVLHDLREAEVPFDISEYGAYLKILEEAGLDRSWRRAVIGAKVGDHPEYYETMSRNRGFNIGVFAERKDAVDWLTARVAG